jgi:hypothetical protein
MCAKSKEIPHGLKNHADKSVWFFNPRGTCLVAAYPRWDIAKKKENAITHQIELPP